jgi:cbb3-type cytochrome oxidase subunit 3
MRRLISPGSYVLFLFFLAGIWLTISPFAMTTQPSGSHWIASTINNVTIGAIMMVVALLGILGYILFALRDMIRESEAKQADEQQASQLAE